MLKIAIFLLFFSSSTAERDSTPVFILDYDMILSHILTDSNPFTEMKSSDFSNIIDEAVKISKVKVILFIEESFCSEDVSFKDRQGTPFYHLSQGLRENKVKFLPAVSQPYKTLKQYFKPEHYNTFYLSDSSTQLKIYDGTYKYYYIYFKDDIGESKAISLRRHDLLMREIYFVVKQIASSPVVAFYTGKMNPIAVEKLSFVPVKPQKVRRQPGVTITSSGALFRFSGVYTTAGTRRSTFSQIPLIAEETWEKQRLNTRMAYSDFELEFEFIFKEDSWIVENVMLLEWGEEVGRTEMKVGAPWEWSYVCSEPLVLVNLRDGSAVTISQYQIQPFQDRSALWRTDSGTNNTGNDTRAFGPAINCGPYFNSQILAGLMVTMICLGILTYGVVSLYNCTSNDRYDDPNGKPLVIAFEGSHG